MVIGSRQVCRRFHQIYCTSPTGEYAVELDLNNLKNSPSMTFSTAERLRRLREYRRAWRNLQWTTETTLQLTGDTILRLHGSILGRCEADTGSNRFDFMQVPSQFRNISRKHWTLDIPNVQPNDFELDTLQNLLVVMERMCVTLSASVELAMTITIV